MREPRAVVAVLAGQQAVRGMMPVLLVSFAVEVLRAGDPGVGILNAATGAGGLLGGAIALVVAHRSRLPAAFAAGTAVWGVALVVPGLLPMLVATVLALVVGGMGRAVVEVTGVTLLQRAIPVGQRRRVFAVVESIVTLAMAVGAVVGAGLVALAGPGGALVVAGGLVVVLAVVTWPIVRIADARMPVPEADIRLLRSVPMFRPLSLSTTEEIAAAVRHVEVAAGTDVVRQGEHGDRFYIIESGRLEVIVDGSPILGELGPGESFGEIALIRDVPRTATVRAIATSRLSAIDRGNFLAAVSGRQDAAAAAEEVIRGRLGA
jgi:MFS family permease